MTKTTYVMRNGEIVEKRRPEPVVMGVGVPALGEVMFKDFKRRLRRDPLFPPFYNAVLGVPWEPGRPLGPVDEPPTTSATEWRVEIVLRYERFFQTDTAWWDGSGWTTSARHARAYPTQEDARSATVQAHMSGEISIKEFPAVDRTR